MGNSCFAGWLAQEVESAQNALLTRIEQLDTLRYVEAPKLRNEYMVKIGTTEDEVLNAELDAKMLQRKLELIQIKRNRREPIDMAEIDQQIEAERQVLLGAGRNRRCRKPEAAAVNRRTAGRITGVIPQNRGGFSPTGASKPDRHRESAV